MTWNHRLVHQRRDGTDFFGIHEVFYDEDGRPVNVTVDPMDVGWFESKEEIALELHMMAKALDEPVLEYEDFHEVADDA